MLYIIKVLFYNEENKSPLSLIKIGYCNEEGLDNRMSTYRNCLLDQFKIIKTIPDVTRSQEGIIHRFLSDHKYTYSRFREWYMVNSYIEEFISSISLEKVLEIEESYLDNKLPNNYSIKSGFIDWVSKLSGINVTIKDKLSTLEDILAITGLSSDELDIKLGSPLFSSFLINYYTDKSSWRRLRMVCEFYFKHGYKISNRLLDNLQDIDPVKELFLAAGPELCRTCSYRITDIRKRLGTGSFSRDELDQKVYRSFKEGELYKKCDIKLKLQEIFNETGYPKKAKATSIEEWFKTDSASLREGGKKYDCFRLTERLDKFDKLYD